jgi:hypothetical protein
MEIDFRFPVSSNKITKSRLKLAFRYLQNNTFRRKNKAQSPSYLSYPIPTLIICLLSIVFVGGKLVRPRVFFISIGCPLFPLARQTMNEARRPSMFDGILVYIPYHISLCLISLFSVIRNIFCHYTHKGIRVLQTNCEQCVTPQKLTNYWEIDCFVVLMMIRFECFERFSLSKMF